MKAWLGEVMDARGFVIEGKVSVRIVALRNDADAVVI